MYCRYPLFAVEAPPVSPRWVLLQVWSRVDAIAMRRGVITGRDGIWEAVAETVTRGIPLMRGTKSVSSPAERGIGWWVGRSEKETEGHKWGMGPGLHA